MLEIEVPPRFYIKPEPVYFTNGYPRTTENVHGGNAGSIFTGGSVENVQWPELAVASAACLQLDHNNVHRLIVAQVPSDFPI